MAGGGGARKLLWAYPAAIGEGGMNTEGQAGEASEILPSENGI